MMPVACKRKALEALEERALKIGGPLAPSHVLCKSCDSDIHALNQERQEQWAREMKSLTQGGAREVAVLLFSWEKDRDQNHSMDTTNELNDLRTVFEDKYNFKVYTKLLSTHRNQPPRYQLNSIFNDFLSEHDKPGSLLIIYYGGHGVRGDHGEEELRLMGGNPDDNNRSSTELNWHDVEPTLYRLSADLLLIFDCCFAGQVARYRRAWPASKAHFEFMASTAFDKPAQGPRSRASFTRAMINALNELATAKSFSTKELKEKIMQSEVFRERSQNPFVDDCGKRNSFHTLRIYPNRPRKDQLSYGCHETREAVNFYLHLKYVFKEKPSRDHIKGIAERLNDLIRNDQLPLANVLWEGLSEYNPRMSMADAAHMLKMRLGRRRSSSSEEGRLELTASTEAPSTTLPQRTLTTLTMDKDQLISDETW